MTPRLLTVVITWAAAGALLAFISARLLVAHVPERLVRVNVNQKPVPAWLGLAIVPAGTVVALIGGLVFFVGSPNVLASTLAIALLLGAAGLWDDLRGRELPRGFSGHLSAARSGRLTGGLVKILAGAVAGVVAGLLVADGWGIVQVALLVGGTANLVNLFDRAPGRAGKVTLLLGVPLIAPGEPDWSLAATGFLGAMAVLLPLDLGERAMLGDAGANPLGGLLGLGLALSLGPTGRWVAIAAVVLLNALSEWVSFSEVIAKNGALRKLDMLGRKAG